MLLTEEQARTKWCPLVRNCNEPGCNRDGRNRPFGICIASECMAWRWRDLEHQTHTKLHRDGADPAIPPSGDGWESAIEDEDGILWRRVNPDRRGFCGLAGPVEG